MKYGNGFFGLMFLLFLGLKLAHIIEWSWWLVFAPLWGPAAVVLLVAVVVAPFFLVKARREQKARKALLKRIDQQKLSGPRMRRFPE